MSKLFLYFVPGAEYIKASVPLHKGDGMEVPELVINLAGEEFTLTEFNTWVCLFTEVSAYDHLYVHAPSVFVVFECRQLLTQLMHLGFPMQVRRCPTPWDLSAYDQYIAKQLGNIDFEIDQLEGEADAD